MEFLNSIPDELKARPQWVAWQYEKRKDKLTKVPYCARTGVAASTTDPTTWSTYEEALAVAATCSGIGFVFTMGDPYVGVDLDCCLDPATQELLPFAAGHVALLDTYTEVTPSGKGLHLILRANLPQGRRRRGPIEMYEQGRFFTMTGRSFHAPPLPIARRQAELQQLHRRVFPLVAAKAALVTAGGGASSETVRHVDDDVLIDAAQRTNPRFARLWAGDIGQYSSQSEADAALMWHLAWWTHGDAGRMLQLARESALAREKWDERRGEATWIEREARQAIEHVNGGYEPAATARITPANGSNSPPFVASVASVASVTSNGAVAFVASVAESSETRISELPSFAGQASSAEPPDDLEPEALYGLLGDIVRRIEPHTESHPAALLASFIVSIGCLLGSGRYVYRDGARHAGNEFACLVGLSGSSRKGTATRRTDELLKSVTNSTNSNSTKIIFHVTCMREVKRLHGLGSGEALVASLCDQDADGGPPDPRRLVFEEEFSRCLKAMGREGSTLSENLRQAWDGGVLASRTKGKRLEARDSHVAVLGHITDVELKQELSRASMFNGFANRFLWICTRRVRSLPFGGGDPPTAELVLKLRETLEFAETVGRIDFDEPARELWAQGGIYDLLTNRPKGLLGAVTSRAEAHVTRLAMLYAVLDGDREIRSPHLLAALAVWDYSERSCAYIFGRSTGDDYADQIDELLREAYPGALSRTDIRNHYGRHAAPGRIEGALKLLKTEGRAEIRKMVTPGRPVEMWVAKTSIPSDQSDKSDISPLRAARRWVSRHE